MKTMYLVILITVFSLTGFAQRNSFTYPGSGNAVNDTLGTLSAADGVSMLTYLRKDGTCQPTSSSFRYNTSHVSSGAIHRQSTYSTNCKDSRDVITFNFTQSSMRPRDLKFSIWDVDNGSDSVAVLIYSGSSLVPYSYHLYPNTFITAKGNAPVYGFNGSGSNDSKRDSTNGRIDISVTDPMTAIDSVVIYKVNNRDASGSPSQSYEGFNWLTSATTLPVRLTSFTATATDNRFRFNWEAAEEIGTKEYHVEYSTNGRTFYPTGAKVAATGTRNGEASYSQLLELPVSNNVLFFRLVSTDYDGKVFYSKTIKVANPVINQSAAYPTYFGNSFSVSLDARVASRGSIKLVGMDGKVLLQQSIMVEKGKNSITVPVTRSIPKGVYAVVGELDNDAAFYHKLIKE